MPIVEHLTVPLEREELSRIDAIARRQLSRRPHLASIAPFGNRVRSGCGPWPNLVFEDHSSISLYSPSADPRYAYRSLLLAGEGDIFALGAERNPTFERYCRDTLGLGRVEILSPRGDSRISSLARRCTKDRRFLESVAQIAHENGGLNLLPYIGDGKAWALARAVAAMSDVEIRVAASPPGLTHCVNNKLWFEAGVEEVLGRGALPEVRSVNGPATLSYHVRDLTRRYATIAVKVPSAASSLGNIIVEAREITGLSLATLRDHLCGLLTHVGWRGEFPLLVTAWEQPLLCSPSVQLWIPHSRQGMPVIEGIFDQFLVGKERAFSGAEPIQVSPPVRDRLAKEAMRLAYLFQRLGYFGRCSFDAIVIDEDELGGVIHWVECNGRWGGVSVPMTLANRLVGDWLRHPFVIVEGRDQAPRARSFSEVSTSLRDSLFVAGKHPLGAVILTPGPLETGTGFDLIALGDNLTAAKNLAREVVLQLSE